jgi:diacylglycerol kinase family enzyme
MRCAPGGLRYSRAVSIERWLAGKPAVLFANPTAQSGQAAEWVKTARAYLDAAGVPHRFEPTEPAGGTVEVVRRAIDDDGHRVIIYMGGDGTFAEVAKGILASEHARDVAMGMLPTGTANDQGKSFGLAAGPGALERNVAVIAAGAALSIDVGMITIHGETPAPRRDLFFDSFSIGLGAATLATRNRDRELVGKIPGLGLLYRDNLVYAGALVQRFLESYVVDIKFDVSATIDDAPYRFADVLDIIVKNTRIFGGEWVLDPRAEADDGMLELIPITGRRDFTQKILSTFRASPISEGDLRGLGFDLAPPVAGRRFVLDVHVDGPRPAAQLDGEEVPAGDRYEIEVAPRCLRLIVPREEAHA